MKPCSRTVWLMAALITLISGCAQKVDPPPYIAPVMPSGAELEHIQDMLALSMISYSGELITGSNAAVEAQLAPCIIEELEQQPLTKGQWRLVWGPAVYKFKHAKLDDNMMYVVQGINDPTQLVVVVRGTNGTATLDWLFEDFAVFHSEAWPTGNPPEGSDPRISKAIHIGLGILQNLKPSTNIPGEGFDVQTFLAQTVQNLDTAEVTVSGHSLAGALAPTLALWLSDTQHQWDPNNKAAVSVYAYAGPTSGNADFAAYSDSQVGAAMQRVHNPHDIVPMAWNLGTLEQIPKIFDGVVKFPDEVQLALDAILDLLKHSTYTHTLAEAPPFPGTLNTAPKYDKFFAQAGWQHVCGYICGLEINDKLLPIRHECKQRESGSSCTCP